MIFFEVQTKILIFQHSTNSASSAKSPIPYVLVLMLICYKNILNHKDFPLRTGIWLHSLLSKTYLSDKPLPVFIADLPKAFMTAS